MKRRLHTTLPPNLRRRQLLLAVGGAAAAAGLSACGGGGGGGSDGDTPPPAESALLMQTYPVAAGSSQAVFSNDAGGTISNWTSTADGALTQSLYDHGGRKIRTFYGPGGQVLRVVDEETGAFMTSTVVSAERTDYNAYDASGRWQGGFAVLDDGDGTYSTAQILSSSGLQGSQITGTLSGAVVASFSLLPGGNSGLGPVTPLTTSANVFASARRAASPTLAFLDRLTDRMFARAYAQTAPGSTASNFFKAAWLAGAGALVYTSTIPLAPLIGAALIGYGVYKLKQGVDGIIDSNVNLLDQVSDRLLGNSVEEFVEGNDSLSALRDKVKGYLDRGSSALDDLPTLSSMRSEVKTKVENVASTIKEVSTNTWQQITSDAPEGETDLSGLLVDNSGQTYPVTGTFDPADDSISFETGPVAGTQISGSGTAPDGSLGSGTYTIDRNGNPQTGTFTAQQQALGACRTQQSSGGQGAFTNSYDLGQDSGSFSLSYQMYSIPDKLEVMDTKGTVLFSTNGLVSGSQTVNVPFSGGRIVFVVVSAPTSGTAWDYEIGCPT
jgi:hypothetical protein